MVKKINVVFLVLLRACCTGLPDKYIDDVTEAEKAIIVEPFFKTKGIF